MQLQEDSSVKDNCFCVVQGKYGGVTVSSYGATEEEAAILLREWTTLVQLANDDGWRNQENSA